MSACNCAAFGTIMEAEEHEMSPVSDACQQLTEGLTALSARDNVTPTTIPATVTAPVAAVNTFSTAQSMPPYSGVSPLPQPAVAVSGIFPGHPAYNMGVISAGQPMSVAVGSPFTVQQHQPLNPVILNHSGLHLAECLE